METFFLLCAVFGGTVLIAQFLLGFGGDHDGDEGPEDAPDSLGHSGDGGHDDAEHDAGDDGDAEHDSHHAAHHYSTWMFGVLTFRTVMIGLTFFGLTGKAAATSGFGDTRSLVVAVACALASMYGVYFLMRGLYRLTADGTERIGRAIGEEGTVYLTVPGENQGVGKVHMVLQNRTVEYEAMTAGPRIPTGARVVVVDVLGSDRVEVEPVIEPARNSHV